MLYGCFCRQIENGESYLKKTPSYNTCSLHGSLTWNIYLTLIVFLLHGNYFSKKKAFFRAENEIFHKQRIRSSFVNIEVNSSYELKTHLLSTDTFEQILLKLLNA